MGPKPKRFKGLTHLPDPFTAFHESGPKSVIYTGRIDPKVANGLGVTEAHYLTTKRAERTSVQDTHILSPHLSALGDGRVRAELIMHGRKGGSPQSPITEDHERAPVHELLGRSGYEHDGSLEHRADRDVMHYRPKT